MTYSTNDINSITDFWCQKIEGIHKNDRELLPLAIKTYTSILLDFKTSGEFPIDYTSVSRLTYYAFIKCLIEPEISKEEIISRAQKALSLPTKELVQEYVNGLTVMAQDLKSKGAVAVYPGSIHSVYSKRAASMIEEVREYIAVLDNKRELKAQIPAPLVNQSPLKAPHKI